MANEADRTFKQHDTWPPLRGHASDANGPLNLSEADKLIVILKCGPTRIKGEAVPIWPLDEKGNNWEYVWAEGDTANTGLYECELEIVWDETASPPRIETVPDNDNPTVEIVADLG